MSAPHHIESWSGEDGMWAWRAMDAQGGMVEQSTQTIEDWTQLTSAMVELYPGVPIFEVDAPVAEQAVPE